METEGAAAADLTWRWHDNVIHGLSFDRGEPDKGDWRSDLILDIDHIVEWLCAAPGKLRFRVAPARLTFHGVTDFAISVDQGDSDGRTALIEWSIDRVERRPRDRPDDWRWTVHLNAPPGGTIAFCASGFTQTETADAVLLDEQRLPRSARHPD